MTDGASIELLTGVTIAGAGIGAALAKLLPKLGNGSHAPPANGKAAEILAAVNKLETGLQTELRRISDSFIRFGEELKHLAEMVKDENERQARRERDEIVDRMRGRV